MLRICCELLGISTDDLPSLKDKNRVKEQLMELTNLKKSPTWKLMYGHLETPILKGVNDT